MAYDPYKTLEMPGVQALFSPTAGLHRIGAGIKKAFGPQQTGGPGLDINQMRQDAQQAYANGDYDMAMRLNNQADAMERNQKAEAARQRQADAAVLEANQEGITAEVERKKAEASKAQVVREAMIAGKPDVARRVANGSLSPKDGMAEIEGREKEARSEQSQIEGEKRRAELAKQTSRETAEQRTERNRAELGSALNVMMKSNPQKAREIITQLGGAEGIKNLSPGEVEVYKTIATRQANLDPEDGATGKLQFHLPTGEAKAEAVKADAALEQMVEDAGAEGDNFFSTDTRAYKAVLASGIQTLVRERGMAPAVARQRFLAEMKEAFDNGAQNSDEVINYISNKLEGTTPSGETIISGDQVTPQAYLSWPKGTKYERTVNGQTKIFTKGVDDI